MPIHIPITDQSYPVSIEVKARYRTIYVLRARCERHELDKMDSFYLMGNMTAPVTFRKLRSAIRKAFPRKYGCRDKIKFSEEAATDYRWDTKLNQAVEIKT